MKTRSLLLSPYCWPSLLARALLFASVLLSSPSPEAQAQHYTFSQFGQSDGLLNEDVSAIVQDRRGVLWVGTENGLFRADGSHFVKAESFEGARHGSVAAMHVDAAGRVWVLGAKQLVFFDESAALHAVPYSSVNVFPGESAAIASLPDEPDLVYVSWNNQLTAVGSSDGGRTWVSSAAFSPESLAAHPDLARLHGLAADPGHRAFWAPCGEALCELHTAPGGMLVTVWDSTRGIPKNYWTSVVLARDGRVWARGTGDVVRLDSGTGAVDRFGDPSGGAAPQLRSAQLVQDADGTMIANLPDGLARLVDGRWQRLTSASGLPSSQIVTAFFDRSGGFWLAPRGGGLWRWLGYGNWQAWTRSDGLSSNVVWNMTRDQAGQLWVAATDGLGRLDEKNGRMLPFHPATPWRETESVAADQHGHLWVGTSTGRLFALAAGTSRTREVVGDLGVIFAIKAERPGAQAEARVWVCAASGLWYVSGADHWQAVHRVIEVGAPRGQTWAVTQDGSGTLWFSAEGGIYRNAQGVWTHIQFPDGAKLVDDPALEAAPDGTLWIQSARPNPLLHIRIQGEQAKILAAVPDETVGSDDISFLKLDRRGWLWVGTDMGVYAFDGQHWVHCTEEDGLISNNTDTGSVYEDADGSMWFGTAGGLSHLLRPAELFHVPPLQISSKDVRLGGIPLQAGEHPRFDLRAPDLFIELFSTYYKRPHAVVFQYRFEGLQKRWQAAEGSSFHFSGLAPGDYTLSIQAMDKRVHTFSEPIHYTFTVLPPWYGRDRTKIGAGLLFLLAGGCWWRLSLYRLKASEADLKVRVDRQTAQLLAEKEQLECTQRELVETAKRDALTGLLNRSAIFDALERMRKEALHAGFTLSVIMADLDHFKSINDQCGHTVGDAVLRECASRFRETLRPGDALGRYGGEELLIVIPHLQPSHAVARVEEIRRAIASRPVVHGGHVLEVTCSFGVAWLNAEHRSVESVVNSADEALYQAKQNGRNRVEFAPEAAEEAYAMYHS